MESSIDVENPYFALATSLRNELESLVPSGKYSIRRVPENLRQFDEKAYTPRTVSIVPIHHGMPELKAMEEYKRRCLQNFLQRTQVRIEDFIKVIKEKEAEVCSCYAEKIELNSDDFVKLILIDAAFIFEVLLMDIIGEHSVYDWEYDSPRNMFNTRIELCMLENQLPFFILLDLFTLANIEIPSDNGEKFSFLQITHNFTKCRWSYLGIEDKFDESQYSMVKVKHLVDFL